MSGNGESTYPFELPDMTWSEKTAGEYEDRYRDILRPKIEDKPKPIRIEVLAEDIKAGVRNIVSNSPVTIAIKRSSRLPGDVIPLWTIVRIGPTWYSVPRNAQRAVEQFDAKKKIKPFAFFLRPMPDLDYLVKPDLLGYSELRVTGGAVRVFRPGLVKRSRLADPKISSSSSKKRSGAGASRVRSATAKRSSVSKKKSTSSKTKGKKAPKRSA